MAAYTEAQRVQIRKYLGYPSLFHQFDPSIEAAITATQAVADGGALPTDDTQLSILAVIDRLESIQSKISNLYCSLEIMEAGTDKVKLNAGRAVVILKNEGRRLVTELCIPLGLIGPRKDIFSSLPVNVSDYPFSTGY